MTKSRIAVISDKKEGDSKGEVTMVDSPPTPVYIPIAQPDFQEKASSTTCIYVTSILATIFCCLPCGVIGMVHAITAKHEGERGNMAAHKTRLCQAKCWTGWSIGLGLTFLIISIIFMAGVCARQRHWNRWGDDEVYAMGDVKDFYAAEGMTQLSTIANWNDSLDSSETSDFKPIDNEYDGEEFDKEEEDSSSKESDEESKEESPSQPSWRPFGNGGRRGGHRSGHHGGRH